MVECITWIVGLVKTVVEDPAELEAALAASLTRNFAL